MIIINNNNNNNSCTSRIQKGVIAIQYGMVVRFLRQWGGVLCRSRAIWLLIVNFRTPSEFLLKNAVHIVEHIFLGKINHSESVLFLIVGLSNEQIIIKLVFHVSFAAVHQIPIPSLEYSLVFFFFFFFSIFRLFKKRIIIMKIYKRNEFDYFP